MSTKTADAKDWNGNKKSAFSQIGASNHSLKERESNDFYATEPIAIDALVGSVAGIPHKVWECACGQGHLSERLRFYGHEVASSDLVDRGYGYQLDFLAAERMPNGCSCIVTNPPYKYALEFILHALSILPEGGSCVMLLKTSFLEGKKRYEQLFSITPPSTCCSSSSAFSAPRTETSRRCVRMVALPLPTHGMCLRRVTLVTQSSNGFKADMT